MKLHPSIKRDGKKGYIAVYEDGYVALPKKIKTKNSHFECRYMLLKSFRHYRNDVENYLFSLEHPKDFVIVKARLILKRPKKRKRG